MIVIIFVLFFVQLNAMADVDLGEVKQPEWHKVAFDHDDRYDDEYVQDAMFRFDQKNEQWLAALIRATTADALQQAKLLIQKYPLEKVTDLGGLSVDSHVFDLKVFSRYPRARYMGCRSNHEEMLKSLARSSSFIYDVDLCIIRGLLRENVVLSYAPKNVALCSGQRLFLCWPEDRATLLAQLKSKTVDIVDAGDARVKAAALAINMLTLLKPKIEKTVKDGSPTCKCVLQ